MRIRRWEQSPGRQMRADENTGTDLHLNCRINDTGIQDITDDCKISKRLRKVTFHRRALLLLPASFPPSFLPLPSLEIGSHYEALACLELNM